MALITVSVCLGQNAQPSDPVAETSDLPFYIRVLPKPEIEPWRKITAKQRLDQYASLTFSPLAGLGAISGAAISQAINSPEEWGQGWDAYGIRVASSYGSTLVGNTITYGAAALFHEDNRYFRSRSETFAGRLGSVIISPYVARNDEGRKKFSASMLLGSAGYSGIQLAWSPSSWQGWNNVGLNYAIWYGEVAGVNLVREFYPSVARYFRNKHASHQTATPAK
jgi:hypothetical protein